MKKERKGSSVEARRICDEGEELMCASRAILTRLTTFNFFSVS